MKYLALILLLPTLAWAEPSTTEQCRQLLDAYGQIEVKASQAQLVSGVQQGIAKVCRGLIESEKPKPTPEPEEEKK